METGKEGEEEKRSQGVGEQEEEREEEGEQNPESVVRAHWPRMEAHG